MICAAPSLAEPKITLNPLPLLPDATREMTQELDNSLKPAFLALLAQLLVTTNVPIAGQTELPTAANHDSSQGSPSEGNSWHFSSIPVSLPYARVTSQMVQVPINEKSASLFPATISGTHALVPDLEDGEIVPAHFQQPQPSNRPLLTDLSALRLANDVTSAAKRPGDDSPVPQQLPDAPSIQPALSGHPTLIDNKQQAPADAAIPTKQRLSVPLSSITLSKLITRMPFEHTVEHTLHPQPAGTTPAFRDFLASTLLDSNLASLHVQEHSIHLQQSTLDRVGFTESTVPASISSPIASPHTTIPADRPEKISSEVEAHLLASQVTSTILRHVRTGEHTRVLTIHLTLEPPDLGAVQIQLHFQGSALEARLEVENPNTLTMLSQHREHLYNTLEQSGINVRTLVISFQGGESGHHPYREENEQLPIKKPNRPRSGQNIDSDAILTIEAVNLVA